MREEAKAAKPRSYCATASNERHTIAERFRRGQTSLVSNEKLNDSQLRLAERDNRNSSPPMKHRASHVESSAFFSLFQPRSPSQPVGSPERSKPRRRAKRSPSGSAAVQSPNQKSIVSYLTRLRKKSDDEQELVRNANLASDMGQRRSRRRLETGTEAEVSEEARGERGVFSSSFNRSFPSGSESNAVFYAVKAGDTSDRRASLSAVEEFRGASSRRKSFLFDADIHATGNADEPSRKRRVLFNDRILSATLLSNARQMSRDGSLTGRSVLVEEDNVGVFLGRVVEEAGFNEDALLTLQVYRPSCSDRPAKSVDRFLSSSFILQKDVFISVREKNIVFPTIVVESG